MKKINLANLTLDQIRDILAKAAFVQPACPLSSGRLLECSDNLGGAKTVFMANFDQSVQHQFGSTTTKVIDTSPTLTVYRYDLEDGGGGMVTNIPKDVTAGTRYYEQTGEITLNKILPEMNAELDLITAAKLWLWVWDYNDNIVMYGLENGIDANGGAINLGTAKADQSGYQITFIGKERLSESFMDPYIGFPFDNFPNITVDPPYPVVA